MLTVRDFNDGDRDAFAGAEDWPDGPPMIVEGTFGDTGRGFALIHARNGLTLRIDTGSDTDCLAVHGWVPVRMDARELLHCMRTIAVSETCARVLVRTLARVGGQA